MVMEAKVFLSLSCPTAALFIKQLPRLLMMLTLISPMASFWKYLHENNYYDDDY